jgi:hypothetical protein
LRFAEQQPLENYLELDMVMQFSDSPSPEAMPFFLMRVKKKEFRRRCIKGIAQLKGKDAKLWVQRYLDDPETAADAADAIPFAWKSDPHGSISAWLQVFKYDPYAGDASMMLPIWEIGGNSLLEEFLTALPKSDAKKQLQDAYPLLYGPIDAQHPLQIKATQLLALGLIDQPIPLSKLETVRAGYRDYGRTDFSGELISEVKQIAFFDAETGTVPNPYDELILNYFVPASLGKLDGLECYMTWNEDLDNTMEKVWVIFKGKGYSFEPDYYGDWYDLGAVEAVMDRVCKDAGLSERFVGWDTGDQTAAYIFAEPVKAREAISKLKLEFEQ